MLTVIIMTVRRTMTSYEQPRKASDSSVREMLFLPSAAERLMCAKPHEGLATHLLSQLLLDEEASGEDSRTPVTKNATPIVLAPCMCYARARAN